MIPTEWRDLAEFQLHTAERWLDRGARTQDSFTRFFFYFAGLNALYLLWRKVDGIPGEALNRPPNELRQIQHLLGRAVSAGHVLATAAGCVRFFAERRPIQRMDRPARTRRYRQVGTNPAILALA